MVLPERRTHIMLYYLDDNELSETISHLHADVVVFQDIRKGEGETAEIQTKGDHAVLEVCCNRFILFKVI